MNADVNGFDATGIKSIEFQPMNMSDLTMELLGESRDVLPINVDVSS